MKTQDALLLHCCFLLLTLFFLSQLSHLSVRAQLQARYFNFAGGDNEFTVKDSDSDATYDSVFMIGELSPSSPLSQNGTYPCGIMKYTGNGTLVWYKALINETLTKGFHPTSATLSQDGGFTQMLFIGGFTQMEGSLSSEATACQLDYDGNLLGCIRTVNPNPFNNTIAKIFDIVHENSGKVCFTGYMGYIDDTHTTFTSVFVSCQKVVNPQTVIFGQSTLAIGINAGYSLQDLTSSYIVAGVIEGSVQFSPQSTPAITQQTAFVAKYQSTFWSWRYLHPKTTYGYPPSRDPFHTGGFFFPDEDASIKSFDIFGAGAVSNVKSLLSTVGSADNGYSKCDPITTTLFSHW